MKNRIHNSLVRVSGSHLKEQVIRFLRLFAATFVLQVPTNAPWDRSVLIAAAVGAVEVIVRQWAQVVPTTDVTKPGE